VVTLADREISQASFGFLGLSYVAQACSWEINAVQRGVRWPRVRFGEGGAQAVGECVALVAPRREAFRVGGQVAERAQPGLVGGWTPDPPTCRDGNPLPVASISSMKTARAGWMAATGWCASGPTR
jgi:hypothetical protein